MNKEFTVAQKTLYQAMQAVRRIIESGTQTPTILNQVLLQTEGEKLTVTAATQQLELSIALACKSDSEFVSTLPAAKLADLCQSFPTDAELKVSFQENMGTVTSGKNRFTLKNLSSEEFPHMQGVDPKAQFSLPRSVFRHLLEKTLFCIGAQDSRAYLNGLLLEVANGKIRAVGTDGNRLALAEVSLEMDSELSVRMLVPRKTVERLLQLIEGDGELQLEIDRTFVRFTMDNLRFTCRLFEDEYPDYEKVVPAPTESLMLASRENLLKVLLRASALLEDRRYGGVNLHISEGAMRLEVENREGERGEMEFAVEYEGDPLQIGFNADFLMRALEKVEGEKVRFYFTSATGSCLILPAEEDSYRYVIMPMRL
ncbi:MAG: DNA polymerase III subunit beta [Gammaproteobacteria bacterium]|nr:DNA polymerase III subunit beta [Gammaproteobacteria bacterium]MDD9824509.1 DNA polymerase III subunit beta [Gammaproteobacteria bacterium]